MKLAAVTNYTGKGLINELDIFKHLYKALNITKADTFNFRDVNAQYYINDNYSHLIICYDYKVSSAQLYEEFLKEVTIPKIFIVDTIPEKHRELNQEAILKYTPGFPEGFSALSKSKQNKLYNDHADALVFFNDNDKELFDNYYKVSDSILKQVIPPALGKEENIKVKLDGIKINNRIAYNGIPSYANGIDTVGNLIANVDDYTLDIFGTHGRLDFFNEFLINSITGNVPHINFRARLKNDNLIYSNYSTYLFLPTYDTFDFFTCKCLLNGVFPILGRNSNTLTYLKDYPFTILPQLDQFKYTAQLLKKSKSETLRNILKKQESNLKLLSNESILNQYTNLINKL